MGYNTRQIKIQNKIPRYLYFKDKIYSVIGSEIETY